MVVIKFKPPTTVKVYLNEVEDDEKAVHIIRNVKRMDETNIVLIVEPRGQKEPKYFDVDKVAYVVVRGSTK